MTGTLPLIMFALLVVLLCIMLWLVFRMNALTRLQAGQADVLGRGLEEKHRLMLGDLHDGLNKQGDRITLATLDSSERLRERVTQELTQTREAMQSLQLAQRDSLANTREELLKQLAGLSSELQAKQEAMRVEVIGKTLQTLAEQGRADQEAIQSTMKRSTEILTLTIDGLTKSTDARLEQISGKVAERLDEGFKKTNETFTNVMTRLATIDEAQKKIDGLTTNVVSLQNLLGDKRSRGAFGEVQLEGLVRNILPPDAYAFQEKLSNGNRVDCLLILPAPTGKVPVDAKFPLENYHRMLQQDLAESERLVARRQFKSDIKKHIDDIGMKYLIRNETSDGAVMFVPAEAVFAEIHAYHSDLVEYAMHKHVWIVSPTTLMAVLNTARAVMKDVQMREQVHIIQSELGKLSVDFKRFDERMKRLADNIRKANEEAGQVEISSRKISDHFAKIEAVDVLEDKSSAMTS
ncbi:MAG: DNA recombination protein RmuC [Gallionella sp.]|nr:DNA recombination protein RmuC [Gallionella sp.]